MGRIDVRVVVLIGYLAERHDSVTVSSLFSGHRKYARPGVVSAHIVRARSRHRRRRRHVDCGAPAARRPHRGSGPLGAPPPRRAPAAAGDLAARPGRPVVPAARPRRPHPRWLLAPSSLTREDGRVVCEHLLVAARPLRRMRGLLGRSEPTVRRRNPPSPGRLRSTRSSCASRSTSSSSTARRSSSGSSRRFAPGGQRAGGARRPSSSSQQASASAAASRSATASSPPSVCRETPRTPRGFAACASRAEAMHGSAPDDRAPLARQKALDTPLADARAPAARARPAREAVRGAGPRRRSPAHSLEKPLGPTAGGP